MSCKVDSMARLLLALCLAAAALATDIGSQKENELLSMKIQECSSGGCRDGRAAARGRQPLSCSEHQGDPGQQLEVAPHQGGLCQLL